MIASAALAVAIVAAGAIAWITCPHAEPDGDDEVSQR
jgi:hypothetical protein